MKGEVNILPTILVALVAGLFLGACDNIFHPWQENEQYHFSIFGYLDASADTQWVRVIPVREDFLLDPDKPIDAEVTLEHIESGETARMNDSLVSFAHGVYSYNFWTTMNLHPEQNYLLAVRRSDGKTSHVTVTLPPDFPTPAAVPGYSSGRDSRIINLTFTLAGVKNLADVQTVYSGVFQNGDPSVFGIPHLQDTTRASSGDLRVSINLSDDNQILSTLMIPRTKEQIFIASAGPDYRHFSSVNERVIPLPEGISNIENGTGYLAGIVSKTIPLESCTKDGSPNETIPCEPEPPPW